MTASRRQQQKQEDDAIRAHVNRYALTVVEAVAALPAFEGRGHLAECALARQVQNGTLFATRLYGERRCYYRMIRGDAPADSSDIVQVDEPHRLSEESKIRHFAMLSFCCLGKTRRIRLTTTEVERLGRGQEGTRLSANYYFQPGPPSAFGFLRIDMGGHGRWDRVLTKCCDDARSHAYSPLWRGPIEAGQFEITLATALPQKAERLCRAMYELTSPPGVPIRIAAIPDMLALIVAPPN